MSNEKRTFVKYLEFDGDIYVHRNDLIRLLNNVENDAVGKQPKTPSELLRWLRTALMDIPEE